MGSFQGTSGNDSLVGSSSNDTLMGLAGNDTLDGGLGADLIDGGDGNDVFSANDDSGNDTMLGGNGNDTFNLSFNYSTLGGGTVAKIDAGAGDDTINVSFAQWAWLKAPEVTGGAGVDTYAFGFSASFAALTVTDFTAGAGGDRIDLNALYRESGTDYNRYHGGNPFATGQLKLVQVGNDTQVQGLGYYDTYVQTILVLKNVTASSLTSANFVGGWNPDGSGIAGKTVTASGNTATTLVGDAFNDTISGNAANNTIWAMGGDDLVNGGSGNESILGGYGNDTIYGGAGNDTIYGDGGNNLIDGGDGDDLFINYTLDAGKDTLIGGAGNDLFDMRARADEATATGGAGRDTYRFNAGYSSGDKTLPGVLNVTDFTAGPDGDIIDLMSQLTRNSSYVDGNPFSTANGYARVIQDGADTRVQIDLDGAAGKAYTYATVLTLKTFNAATLTADNFTGGLKTDGSTIIGLVASANNQALQGTSFDDQLTGVSGSNTLNGYGGDDMLVAGSGNASGKGDYLYGGSGNDTLTGGAANDYLVAGDGNDLLSGGDGNDALTAGNGLDTLQGGAGNDTLDSTSAIQGVASLDGGDGDDTFTYGVTSGGLASATGGAGRDVYQPQAESSSWWGSHAFAFTANDFTAGAGGDQIDLSRVLSNTGYSGGNPFDPDLPYARLVQSGANTLVQLSLSAGAGNNGAYYTVLTLKNVDKSALTSANFVGGLSPDGYGIPGVNLSTSALTHTLTGGSYDDTLTGVDGVNYLIGAGGADQLQAGSGDSDGHGDHLYGGAGKDTLLGGSAADQLDGGAGNDLLQGGAGNDSLDGGAGNDTLQGGDGDDTLSIGANGGSDVLDGGNGNDTIYWGAGTAGQASVATGGAGIDVYKLLGDSYVLQNLGTDRYTLSVADFKAGAGGDQIDLYTTLTQLTSYTGGNPFSAGQAYVRLSQSGDDTLLQMSANGADKYVTVLTLKNLSAATLTADNFVQGYKPDGGAISGLTVVADHASVALTGGYLNDTLTALAGANTLAGAGGDDLLQAGSGDASGNGDALSGGYGNDTLVGGVGRDSLEGNSGSNLLQGGDGNDTLVSSGDSLNDTLEGGAGDDSFDLQQFNAANLTIARGGDGNDNFHVAIGGGGLSARLTGDAGRDTYLIAKAGYGYGYDKDYVEITDFTAGKGGDVIDVTELMRTAAAYGYTGGNPLSDSLGYLRLVQNGADVELRFDPSGAREIFGMQTVALLRNVKVADLTADNMIGANPAGAVVPGLAIEGTAGADNLAGGYFDDTIHGNGGNDSLFGFAGNDLLVAGEPANDGTTGSSLDGGNGNDTLQGGSGADSLYGNEGNDLLSGGAGDDQLFLAQGNDSASGGDGDDSFFVASPGNHTIAGGNGNDRVQFDSVDWSITKLSASGGAGVDTYVLDSTAGTSNFHITDFAMGSGGDKLDLSAVFSNLGLTERQVLDALGGGYLKLVQQGANVLVQIDADGSAGSGAARTIAILDNAKAADFSSANLSGKFVEMGWGEILGSGGNDRLQGQADSNRIEGGGGDDTLDGNGGSDTLIGGSGNDTYIVNDGNAVITELANGGVDTVKTSQASYTLGANLEALQYTGDGDFYGTGNASGNLLTGGAGNDTLDGAGGGDVLTGLGGDDSYLLRGADDRVVEAADGGYDLVTLNFTSGAYTLTANVESGALGAAAAAVALSGNELNNYLSGNSGANTLNGGAGNDTLDGGAGTDKLTGGKGDDLFIVDNAGDLVTELASEGNDTVETGLAKYALGANVENLRYTGSSGFAGTGNELANRISGGIGNDTLVGNAGDDTLAGGGGTDAIDGGDGDDTLLLNDIADHYQVARANGVVTLKNTILGESLTIKGIETIVFTDGTRSIADLLLNQTSEGDDYLGGTDGDDRLDGLGGADTMTGGKGDDRYVIDNLKDTIKELAGEGTDTAELVFKAAATYTLGANVENAEVKSAAAVAVNVNGNELDNTIIGNAAANTLSGGAGNDDLDGKAGADKLIGGTGNDTYHIDNAGDVVTENLNEGLDTVYTTLSTYTLGANLENLVGPGNGVLNGTGNALANQIDGGLGADSLSGLAGNDTLRGSVGNDTLLGGDGDDRLEGGIGANLLDGGAGTDTALALDAFSAYKVTRPNATDTVLTHASSGEVLTLRNVEFVSFNGTLMAIQDVQLNVPSLGNDYMRGGSGDDLMSAGAAGADTMAGGDGNDTYQIDDLGDTIVETASGGDQDLAQVALAKAGTYTLGAYVENATVTAAAGVAVNLTGNDSNNVLTGNAAANTLSGGAGNDTLDGGAGADKLIGSTGNDLYKVDNSGDSVTELAGQGSDSVETTLAKYTLGANVENLLYKGTQAFAGTGNELANSIEGSSGNDTLSGLAGDDILKGGAGNDSLLGGDGADQLDAGTGSDIVDGGAGSDTLTLLGKFADYTRSRPNATDMVLTNATTHESITVRNVEKFLFADGLKELPDLAYNTPSINNDSLFGGDGDDRLDGLAGADQMSGGLGNDTYTVDQSGDKVFESADAGDDLVQVAFTKADTFVMGDNIERATITAAAGIAVNVTGNALDNWLIGNAAANTLIGGAGNDTLDGGASADKLSGGLDDDLYLVDNAGDVVTELAGQGLDRVETTLAKYTLTANVEDLQFKGSVAFTGTGNELGNSITGGTGNDTLSGLGGDDILKGGDGNDSLSGGNGDDQLDAGTGVDVVDGGVGIDTLTLLGNFSDYSRSRPNTTDLVLLNTVTHESITVRNVEQFIFADDSKSLTDVAANSASPGNDNLTGTDGNDSIDGGAGIDTMAGGLGNDTYTVDQSGDVVQEGA
ncbi:MAG TPA: calcium-binding protein, partial [Duganella sp.]|nr:calcium-binding protein [Duganella sp.]